MKQHEQTRNHDLLPCLFVLFHAVSRISPCLASFVALKLDINQPAGMPYISYAHNLSPRPCALLFLRRRRTERAARSYDAQL